MLDEKTMQAEISKLEGRIGDLEGKRVAAVEDLEQKRDEAVEKLNIKIKETKDDYKDKIINAKEDYSWTKNSSYGIRTKWDGKGLSFCDVQLTAGTGIMLGNRFELGMQTLFGLTTVMDASEIDARYDDISVHLLSFSTAFGFYFI